MVLINPEWQIMSASYLRGFPARASSFLTVLLNLISANPDVLVRKKKNKVLLTTRYQRRVLHCKSEVSCSVFVCADVDLDNLCAEKETVSLMNPLIGSVIGCS